MILKIVIKKNLNQNKIMNPAVRLNLNKDQILEKVVDIQEKNNQNQNH